MNKEINTIIANLEECIDMYNYGLTPKASNLLVSYIKELKKENKQLKEKLDCDLQWAFKYEKQVDNWNKLKKDLINDINYWQEQEKEWIKLGFIKFGGEANNKIIFKKILNKMQELEGSDSNE